MKVGGNVGMNVNDECGGGERWERAGGTWGGVGGLGVATFDIGRVMAKGEACDFCGAFHA